MSHADEGTLHAYLDGELSQVERSRLDAHLAECASCRDRLAEEQGLIERADRLLTLAAPPEGHVNRPVPLPRRRRAFVVPGAWAASIAAAFLAGWVLRPGGVSKAAPVQDELRQLASAPTLTGQPPVSPSVDAPRRKAPAATPAPQPAAGHLFRGQDSQKDSSAVLPTQMDPGPVLTPGVVGNAAPPALRGAPAAPIAAEKVTVVPAPPPRAAAVSRAAIGTTWTAIAPEPARQMLGADVVRIPGLPIRDILQNPLVPGTVMVEQEVAEGTVIQLLQSRADTVDALDFAEAMDRTVGSLHVRIAGPLSSDSLRKLLRLAR